MKGGSKMIQRNVKWMVIILYVLFLAACVTSGQKDGLKSFSEMTHKERATWMMGIYNSQARDYKAMVARTDLTNEQKDILRKKKSIMTQVWPMINTYTTYINSGAVPTKEVEDQIIKLINDLTALAMPVITEGG
jgi:hypothetical protein